MISSIHENIAAAVLAGAMTLLGDAAHAAAPTPYPTQPIRVIVPFAAGGSTDIVARIVTHRMAAELGQPFIVDNKAGAGGAVGALEAARARPDGYTLSIATVSTMAVNSACRPNDLPYNPLTDFMPVTNFVNVPFVVEVNPAFPAKTFMTFLQTLKEKPGFYTYGSSGTCSVLHLFGEAFKRSTGTDMVHVPYKGAAPAVADAVSGHINVMFDNLPASMSQLQAGRLRPLAVAWPQRLESMPQVPTLAEEGYPDLNRLGWYGLLAPKGTPKEIVAALRAAAVVALKDPAVIAALEKQGASPSGNTSEEFAAEIKAQYEWAKNIVAKSGIKLQ